MSSRRAPIWLAGIILAGALFLSGSPWDGFDGRFPDYTDPRVLAEGAVGDARWVVVSVRERRNGDCLHLRQQGTLVVSSCQESTWMDDYRVRVQVLRGASEPIIFGILPKGTARAEVSLADRAEKRAVTSVQVRTFGESGRYAVGPVPAGLAAADLARLDNTEIAIDLYDARGGPVRP